MTLDWNSIRPLNGDRAKGFEELCAQLARTEIPGEAKFERKGSPDAGVECYAVFPNGEEWGWQSKYFDVLGDAQWSQLDDSVKTALQKHPQLVRYYVCIPLDLPDARIQNRQSARDRWNERVKHWETLASNRGKSAQFLFWGSHELLDRLSRAQHHGRVKFWFGVPGAFDSAWFSRRLDEVIKTAGPRYTPEIHVKLPLADLFEAFGRTKSFFDGIKKRARGIRTKLDRAQSWGLKPGDDDLAPAITAVLATVRLALEAISSLPAQAIDALGLDVLGDKAAAAEAATEYLWNLLWKQHTERQTAKHATEGEERIAARRCESSQEFRHQLSELSTELSAAQSAFKEAARVTNASLILLNGDAGTGKTHLLCDVARHRIENGRPTVLLLGQRFTTAEEPWTQALRQIDLANLSAEEFVGSLEAAAQAADCRLLVMVDALNEGKGREIWPSHLSAFLAQLERSRWISVLVSVRSSYEELVVPEEIRQRAFNITHEGFVGLEYDATRTFFVHYDIELPSAPLLSPEFRNPLFLKTLCSGLHAKVEHRLPRGFHGITACFGLYLSAVNAKLARITGFNPARDLVNEALQAFVTWMVGIGARWLEQGQAEDAINSVYPTHDFERSLYHGLITEGVLIQNVITDANQVQREIVLFAYERLADHLVTRTLLDKHLDIHSPAAAFADNGPLAFIAADRGYYSPGLLEAFCIQVSERTGQELATLAPKVLGHWGIGEAFRKSLVWRTPDAFAPATIELFNRLNRSEQDEMDSFEVLLAVATLPGHPLNAEYLDERLGRDAMPDRDAWWSILLHRSWCSEKGAFRIVDWGRSVDSSRSLDEDAVYLCAITLAWMFATSNRFLRDRATKALVNLLTGRFETARRLVRQFADIDDLYVSERVFAVAYGVAMRSHDTEAVSELAQTVYEQVFAAGSPPAHILLRDYARGVIERALHLGGRLNIEESAIRPPYSSQWPVIPTEEEIKPCLADWSYGGYDSGETVWARNVIASSVMDGDFARYVIGTNSWSTDWLSIPLIEPRWRPNKHRLEELLTTLTSDQLTAWERFRAIKETHEMCHWFENVKENLQRSKMTGEIDSEQETHLTELQNLADLTSATESAFAQARADLEALMPSDQFQLIVELSKSSSAPEHPPKFDLRLVQRYVLKRVFELGWTTERFGEFDRFEVRMDGRAADKTERLGKKYQWIAYHEISALIADHFQFWSGYGSDDTQETYEGPWQSWFRDIDPSNTLGSVPGGTSWSGHKPAWWARASYLNWRNEASAGDWVEDPRGLPEVEQLLRVTDEAGAAWFNLHGYFDWQPELPLDMEPRDCERREVWYMLHGYLIHATDVDGFLEWAKSADFWGRWMPRPLEDTSVFLGEHGWAPASRYLERVSYRDEGTDDSWIQPGQECPVKVRTVAFEYLEERGTFDCSVDDGYTLRLPAGDVMREMGLRWSGTGADFVDRNGQIVVLDPTAHANGPSALLFHEKCLGEYLTREGLSFCWAVIGEKRALGPGFAPQYHEQLRMTGAYALVGEELKGFVRFINDDET